MRISDWSSDVCSSDLAIAEARAHGDLKENAEYHAAREQQGFIEARIKQLESVLSNAQVIDISTLNAGSRVVFGAAVELCDVETDETVTRSEEHTSELQSLMRISYAVFCLKKNTTYETYSTSTRKTHASSNLCLHQTSAVPTHDD